MRLKRPKKLDNELTQWLVKFLEHQGWSQRELARRMKVSHTAVSSVVSGGRRAGWEFCRKLAPVAGESPNKLFRMARRLPKTGDNDERRDIIDLLDDLETDYYELVYDFLQFLIDRNRKKK